MVVLIMLGALQILGYNPLGIIFSLGQNQDLDVTDILVCDESLDIQNTQTVGFGDFWQCPSTASRCVVYVNPIGTEYAGWYWGTIGFGPNWYGGYWCGNAQELQHGIWTEINPATKVFHNYEGYLTVRYKVFVCDSVTGWWFS